MDPAILRFELVMNKQYYNIANGVYVPFVLYEYMIMTVVSPFMVNALAEVSYFRGNFYALMLLLVLFFFFFYSQSDARKNRYCTAL